MLKELNGTHITGGSFDAYQPAQLQYLYLIDIMANKKPDTPLDVASVHHLTALKDFHSMMMMVMARVGLIAYR